MWWVDLLRSLGFFGLAVWAVQAVIKKGIDRAALEHRVRYSALHERRVEVIGKTYEGLVRAERALLWAADVSLAGDESRKRLSEFGTAANAFRDHFEGNRIWLASGVGRLVDDLWETLKQAGYLASDASAEPRTGSLLDARNRMKEKFAPLKSALEAEFRSLLGV